MTAAVKGNSMIPKGGSKCFKMRIIFLLLNICIFAVPVTGYFIRNCHISFDTAKCDNSNHRAVPQDIPPTVTSVDLSSNQISVIHSTDFKNLSHLVCLLLKSNNISQIDAGAFANLIELNKLNLTVNKLVRIRDDLFDGLRNLTLLDLSRNSITTLSSASFKPLTKLITLDISHNNLQHLTDGQSMLHYLPKLKVLSIQNIGLTSFQSWELTNQSLELTHLDVSKNPLEVFKITADVFPSLTDLDISGCGKQQMRWDVHNKTFLRRVSFVDMSGVHMALDDMKSLLQSVNSSLNSLKMNAMTHNLTALINISCTIPSLSDLHLQRNKLTPIRPDNFSLCTRLNKLDLADNGIQTRNISNKAFSSIHNLKTLCLSQNSLSSVPAEIRNLPTLIELDLSSNKISSLECQDFANLKKLKKLYLYQNSISALHECLFKDLIQLESLNLQSNYIHTFNGAFKKYLRRLTDLHLNSNELRVLESKEFMGLKSLNTLSLHDNQIRELKNDSFHGLENLTIIKLMSNDLTAEEINNGCFNDLRGLTSLDLSVNHIKYNNESDLPHPPFSQMSQLKTLRTQSQHRRLKGYLPRNLLQGLKNLKLFDARNIQIVSIPTDIFNHTPQLNTLDLCSNELTDFSPALFSPIRNLTKLYISRATLRSLEFLVEANLTKLEFLQARKNQYSVISENIIKSLPALTYLDLFGNSFTCDCDNAWFRNWLETSNETQVYDASNYECGYPPKLRGMKLLDLDLRFCTVEIDFICFVSTTCAILFFMVVSFTYHFLRWHLVYTYYFFLALLVDSKQKNKQATNQYDAFISYNTHDEQWVTSELLPKLEGDQGWRLCLHHRDFEPGKPIIDNITDSIYASRKTICVISRKYLESEWCSREIQVASFRLFDEQQDVLIMVFLEDIPSYHLSPYYRMRKLLKKHTYLSWTQARECPELFWEKLRQALRSRGEGGEAGILVNVAYRE